jgi:hypothetical protein
MKKSFKHKGWLCKWSADIQGWELYTPSELEQPAGFRYPEIECYTVAQCKEFINTYK